MSQQTYYKEKTAKAGLQPKMSPQPGQYQKKTQLKQVNAKIPSKAVEALLEKQASVTNNTFLEENRFRDQHLGRDDQLNANMNDMHHNSKSLSGSAQPAGQSQVFMGSQAQGLLGRTLAAMKSSSVPNVAVGAEKVPSNGKVSTTKQINKRTTRSDMVKQQSSHEPSPPNASTKCSSSEPHQTNKHEDTITQVAINRQFKNEAVDQVHSNERGPRAQKTRQRHQLKLDTKMEDIMYQTSCKDNPAAESALIQNASWAIKASPIGKKPSEQFMNSGNKEALPARTFDESREDEIIRLIEAHQRERLQIDPMRELEEALMDRTTASLNRRQKPQQLNKNSQVTTSGVEDHSIISPTFIHIDFSREVPLQTITQAEAERFQELAQLRAEQAAQEAAAKEGSIAAKLSFVSMTSVKEGKKKSEKNEDQANSSSDQDLNSGTLRRKRVKPRQDINKLQYRERMLTDHMARKARRVTNQQDNADRQEQQDQEMKGIEGERHQDSHSKLHHLTRHINEWNYVHKGRENHSINIIESQMQQENNLVRHVANPLDGYEAHLRHAKIGDAKLSEVNGVLKLEGSEKNMQMTLTDGKSLNAEQEESRNANVSKLQRLEEKMLEGSPEQTKKELGDLTITEKSIRECNTNQSHIKRGEQQSCHNSNEQMMKDYEQASSDNDSARKTHIVKHKRIEDAAKLVDNHFEKSNEMQYEKKRSAKFHQKRRELCSRVEHFVNSAVIDDQNIDEKTTPNQFGKTFKKQKSGGGLLPPQITTSDVTQDAHEVHNRTMATEDIQAVEETEQRIGERCPATDSSEQFSSNILAETSQMQIRKGRLGERQMKTGDSKDLSDANKMNRMIKDEQEARQRAETFGKSQHDVSFASPFAASKMSQSRLSQMKQSAQQSTQKQAQGKPVRQTRSIRTAKAFAPSANDIQAKGQRKRQNVGYQHVKQMQKNEDEMIKTMPANLANTPQQQQLFNQNNRCADVDQIHESTKQNKTSRQQLDQFAGYYSNNCMMQLSSKYLRKLPPPALSLHGFSMGIRQDQKMKRRRSSMKSYLSEQSQTLHKLMTLTNVVNVCQMQYLMQLQMQQQYTPFMAPYQYNFNPFSQHSWNMFADSTATKVPVEDFGAPSTQQEEAMQVESKVEQNDNEESELKQKQTKKKESLHATLKRLLGPTDGWSSRPIHCNELIGVTMNANTEK